MTGKNIRSLVVSLGISAATVFAVTAARAQETPSDPAGTWTVTLSFVRGTAEHTAVIARRDSILTGTYYGGVNEGRLFGKVRGKTVEFTGFFKVQAQTVVFRYTGTIEGDTMKGTVDMGEYWTGTWTAKKTGNNGK